MQYTLVDRATLKVYQFTAVDAGSFERDDIVAYVAKLVGSPITTVDIYPDPRKFQYDISWMPLPTLSKSST